MNKTFEQIPNLQEIKIRVDAAEDFMCSWLFSEAAYVLPEIDRSQIRQIIAMLSNISQLISEAENSRMVSGGETTKAPTDRSDQYSTAKCFNSLSGLSYA